MPSSSLVRVVEVWVPSEDGQTLTLSSGDYGGLDELEKESRGARLGRGVGLPGRVWERGRAVVLARQRGVLGDQREEAATRAGLKVGVAIPVFDGGELVAVCVLSGGDPTESSGALEAWEPEADRDCLGLGSAYYGSYDGFRRISSLMKFPRGVGLPGRVWESGDPVVFDDLSKGGPFIRAAAAETYGFTTGFGMPVQSVSGADSVLVLLSVRGKPLAGCIEVWLPSPNGACMVLGSVVNQGAAPPPHARGTTVEPGQGLVGTVWQTRRPMTASSAGAHRVARYGTHGVVAALPVFKGDAVGAVVVIAS